MKAVSLDRVQALGGTGSSKSNNQEGNKNIVKFFYCGNFELHIKIE